MGLHELVASDIANILSRDGEAATYTPSGGSASSISIFYSISQMSDDSGGFRGAVMSALVDNADVASPAESDTITIGSDVWTVRDIQGGTKYHLLRCTKDMKRTYS